MVENLEDLVDLEEIYLGNNYLTSMHGLQGHPRLSTIDLDSNDVSTIEEIQWLEGLLMLRHLSLKKTPLEQHWLHVIFLLPILATLNGIMVAAEDKVAACNQFDPTEEVVAALEHASLLKQTIRQYARIYANDIAFSARFRPIVLAGSAGSGKRTLTQRLMLHFPHIFGRCVSHTTRKPRPGEENGVHYHFCSQEDAQQMIEEGGFVEHVLLFGNIYGTSFDSIYKVILEGRICILDLELEGVLALKKSNFNCRYIYVTTPSLEVLQSRLENRMREQIQQSHQGDPQNHQPGPHQGNNKLEIVTRHVFAAHEETLQIPFNSKVSITADPLQSTPTSRRNIDAHASDGRRSTYFSDYERSISDPLSEYQEDNSSQTSLQPNPSSNPAHSFSRHRKRRSNADSNARQDSSLKISLSSVASAMSMADADREAKLMVEQWLEKANRDKLSASGQLGQQQDSLLAEFHNQEGFFDAEIVNDDFDRAYEELKQFVMSNYWQSYEEDNNDDES